MKEKKPAIGAIIPVEECLTKDGSHTIVKVMGDSPEGLDLARKFLTDELKATRIDKNEKGASGRATFGITNWDNCSWNPKGPKPNWATPPENPSNN